MAYWPAMKVSAQRVVSLLGAWAAGPGPLYERLARALAAAMDRGELGAGAVLPTERELARRLAVSRTTVVGAYGLLKDERRLESRQGRGTWVAGPAGGPSAERAFSTELYAGILGGDDGLIDLTAACPPPTSIVAEVVERTSGPALASVIGGRGYLPAGLPALREAIAAHLEGEGLPTQPDQVLVTSGAQQAMVLVSQMLGEPGQTVLVEEATFPGILDVARGAGMRPVGIPLDEGGIVPGALEDLLERVRPRFAYLIPSHQNPTGSVLSAARSRRVAELAARYRVPVVEDHALRQLLLDDRPLPPPIATHGGEGSVLTIGSVSKVLWAGLRVGWIRAPRPTIERLMRLKITADLGSAVIAQNVAAALMPRMAEAIEERRRFLRDGHDTMTASLSEHLPDWSWTPPRGGCTLWVRMPHGDARGFAQVAQRCGVAVVPGQVLSAEGGHADRLRLPFVHDPPVIAEAVRRLARAWELYAGAGARAEQPAGLIV
jgi:DNA-binding transcriptional MocR family regulator